GVTSPEQVEWFHLDPTPGRQLPLWATVCATALRTAIEKRRRLEGFSVQDIRDAEDKARLLAEADQGMEPIKLIPDLLIGAAFGTAASQATALDEALGNIAPTLAAALDETRPSEQRTQDLGDLTRLAAGLLSRDVPGQHMPFHWAIEFPEVFDSSGADKRGFD